MQNVLQCIGVPPLRLFRRPWYTWLCTRPLTREHVLPGNGDWVWQGLRRTSSVSARLLKPLRRPGCCGAGPLSQGGVT